MDLATSPILQFNACYDRRDNQSQVVRTDFESHWCAQAKPRSESSNKSYSGQDGSAALPIARGYYRHHGLVVHPSLIDMISPGRWSNTLVRGTKQI